MDEPAVAAELTERELAQLLRDAERAHGEYERELGERDDDWPDWYARHMLEALRRRPRPGGSASPDP